MLPPSTGTKRVGRARVQVIWTGGPSDLGCGQFLQVGNTAHSHSFVLQSPWVQVIPKDQYPEIFHGFSQLQWHNLQQANIPD